MIKDPKSRSEIHISRLSFFIAGGIFYAWFKKLGLINQAPTKNGGFLPLFNTS